MMPETGYPVNEYEEILHQLSNAEMWNLAGNVYLAVLVSVLTYMPTLKAKESTNRDVLELLKLTESLYNESSPA